MEKVEGLPIKGVSKSAVYDVSKKERTAKGYQWSLIQSIVIRGWLHIWPPHRVVLVNMEPTQWYNDKMMGEADQISRQLFPFHWI